MATSLKVTTWRVKHSNIGAVHLGGIKTVTLAGQGTETHEVQRIMRPADGQVLRWVQRGSRCSLGT